MRHNKSSNDKGISISDENFLTIFESREESEVAGLFVFSHIRMMGYFRLGKGLRMPRRVRVPRRG